MSKADCRLLIPPTPKRRSSKAKPGQPEGKPENVRCRAMLLAAENIPDASRRAVTNRPTNQVSDSNHNELAATGRRDVGASKVNDAATNSNGDGLGPIFSSELFHDVFDMHLNGFFSDLELLTDISITVTFGDTP